MTLIGCSCASDKRPFGAEWLTNLLKEKRVTMSEKIEIAVLVGNGFDLATGFDTSVQSILEAYAEKCGNGKKASGRLADRIQKEGVNEWSDFEIKLGQYLGDERFSENDALSQIAEYVSAKESLDDFLCEYLTDIDNSVPLCLFQNYAGIAMESLCGWLASLPEAGGRWASESLAGVFGAPFVFDFHFVSFNYTSILDRMAGEVINHRQLSTRRNGIEDYYLSPVQACAWYFGQRFDMRCG